MSAAARPVFLLTGIAMLGISGLLTAKSQAPQGNRKIEFAKDVKPLTQKFCAGCHSGKEPPAGVDVSKAKGDADLQNDSAHWERIVKALRSNHMPPATAPQPTREQRELLIAALESILSGNCTLQDPGKVTIRRLNRTEYANTIRDLMGVDYKATADFPSDDVGNGFDNMGDVLTLSPLLMEKYLDAGEKIAEMAIATQTSKATRFEADKLSAAEGTTLTIEGDRNFSTNAVSTFNFPVTVAGSYRVSILAYGQQAGPEPCKMRLLLDGRPIQGPIEVKATAPTAYEIPLELGVGTRTFGVEFLNDYYQPTAADPKQRDRNLAVRHVEVVGPFGANTYPETTTRIIPQQPPKGEELNAAKQYLTAFASRAFRRPVRPEEVEALMRVFKVPFDAKESFNRSMQVAVSAVLVSPQFLFRAELDPKASDPKTPRLLSGFEIASRLSYFLWSSMPDDVLLREAATGKLNEPKAIEHQVDRMMRDPKARSLSNTFAEQWLQLRKLDGIRPDPKRFPNFPNATRNLMVQESKLFFNDVLANDRSILEFLDSKYAFLNAQLAAHYDIGGVTGNQMQRVELPPGTMRGGLLGQGAILMLNSNPTRTSPTKRGKWILEQILGTPPPPPPPGVDELKPKRADGAELTLRQQMEEHRKNPDCASCHARMDPMGFSLENYDAVGRWRFKDEANVPIDATGQLPDGEKFSGPQELKAILMAQKDMFARNLAEKLTVFALGRGVTLRDDCAIDEIVKSCKADGYKISRLIKAIATSDPFRKRKGEQ